MKSLLAVNSEISGIISSAGTFDSKRKESSAKKRLEFLNLVKMYIETQPDEYFVAKEIQRIENRITLMLNQFDKSKYKDPKEALKKYEKDSGIPELRKQLKALRFIKN